MTATSSIPLPASTLDRLLWVVLGLGALGTVGSLVRFWGIRTEYADRLLVLLGSAWAAYQLLPAALAVPVRPRPLLALPLLLLGGVIVPFGWFLQVQTTGGRAAILWFQGGGLILLTAGCILARYGAARLRILAFPLMFTTFALPIPSIIAAPLQAKLQNVTTALAEKALPLFGVPVLQRDGFVLRLAGGDLGVAEACSGIRSMTALTALAAFIAYLRGLGILRGIVLEAATVLIVATVNGVRVVASGLIQEWFGDQYIRGDWHEALGLAMVFLGLGIIVRVAKLLGRIGGEGEKENPTLQSPPRSGEGESLQPSPLDDGGCPGAPGRVRGFESSNHPSPRPETGRPAPSRGEGDNHNPLRFGEGGERSEPGGVPKLVRLGGAIALTAVAISGCLTGLAIGKGMTANEKFVAKAQLDEIPLTIGEGRERWNGTKQNVPEFVTEILGQDQSIFREYENNTGQRIYVWVLFWSTAEMVKGYHHPDVCWGNKGYVSTAKRIEVIEPTEGGSIPATVREFTKDHYGGKVKEFQFVLYWTQEGAHVWDEWDELNAQTGGLFFFDPKLWFGDYQRDSAPNGRIVVLIATPSTDPAPKADAIKFAKMLSDQLYRICPWAGPPHPPSR